MGTDNWICSTNKDIFHISVSFIRCALLAEKGSVFAAKVCFVAIRLTCFSLAMWIDLAFKVVEGPKRIFKYLDEGVALLPSSLPGRRMRILGTTQEIPATEEMEMSPMMKRLGMKRVMEMRTMT